MKRTKWLIPTLVALILVLIAINIVQWHRSKNVSARPAIVLAWSDASGVFDDEARFQVFKQTVSSKEFIEGVLAKPRYGAIRERFLNDWNPNVTKTNISDLYGNPRTLYRGRDRRILEELIEDIYQALRLELDRYQALAAQHSK